MPINVTDRDMMIRTVIGEADDQPPAGQAAVAHVILNRLDDGRWGDTPSQVVLSRGQFEPWQTRAKELSAIKSDSPRYQKAAGIVDAVLRGDVPDVTGGATHFLQEDLVRKRRGGSLPDWANGTGLQIGAHTFYRPPEMDRGLPPSARAFAEEDLLSEWGTGGPKAAGGAPRAAPATPTLPEEEDLLSEWGTKAAPAFTKPALSAAADSDTAAPPSGEEDFINRWIREAHGHGQKNITDLVTGRQPDSWGDVAIRAAAGGLRGGLTPGETLGQGIAATGDWAADKLSRLGIISPESAQSVADWRAGVNARVAQQNQAFEEAKPGIAGEVGRLGGEILATAPIMKGGGLALSAGSRMIPIVNAVAPRVANLASKIPGLIPAIRGGTTGATFNTLTSSASDVPLPEQVGTGAAAGAILGPVGAGVGKLIGAAIDPATATLAKKAFDLSIPLRRDQLSTNPMVRFAGSVAQRLPFTGLGAHVAKQQAAFSRAVAKTFGEDADALTPDVMARAKDRIGNVLDTTLPQLEAHLNPKLSARLQTISDATQYLPQEDARIVNKHLDDILNQFTGVPGKVGAATRPVGAARIDGKQLQALITKGSPLDSSISGGSSNVKNLASQLKDVLLDAVGQTPTGRAKTAAAYVQKLQAFKDARYQYKNMKTVEDLAEKAPEGQISPALLMGQVRQSFGNMAYGGGGDLADLARVGQRFLKEPPSSGTAERLAAMEATRKALKTLGVLGGGAIGGIGAFDPEHFQRDVTIGGAGLLGTLLAARGGSALLRNQWLAKRAVQSALKNKPSRLGPILTTGFPLLAPRQNPLMITNRPAAQP